MADRPRRHPALFLGGGTVSPVKRVWLDTGSGPGRVVNALMSAESAMHLAYREWLAHAQGCDACGIAATPESGCASGQNLWGNYRSARVSTAGRKS